MAPFIPQGIINPELNLFFALMLGIGFGYVLEQAGFSSSRKLAGVFYGYDFVVLRVFFTAGITAMTGLVFFSYMGWVDMSLVYINPLFLWSAVAGGVIMGFGFILGGFCPGTSVVAAVIGKIDAMVFIGGMFIGIFVFGHFYELFQPLYSGSFLGNPTIYTTLGISKNWFAFLLVLMALTAFAVTQLIEDKVNNTLPSEIIQRPNYRLPAFLILALVSINLFLPAERSSTIAELSPGDLLQRTLSDEKYVSVQEVAYHIMNRNSNIVLIDTRAPEAYQHFSLPGAVNIPAGEVLQRQWQHFLKNDPRRKVFFSFAETDATTAWLATTRAGHHNLYILRGGLNHFFAEIFEPQEWSDTNNNVRKEFAQRFFEKARSYFLEGKAVTTEPPAPIPVRTLIEIETPGGIGGC
jgi:rhodanese-related sulfurtransferase/uncharacterized membrane protein YedE/YeeE